jgi:hypothetical protein
MGGHWSGYRKQGYNADEGGVKGEGRAVFDLGFRNA